MFVLQYGHSNPAVGLAQGFSLRLANQLPGWTYGYQLVAKTLIQNGDFFNFTPPIRTRRALFCVLVADAGICIGEITGQKIKYVCWWCAMHHLFVFKWCVFAKSENHFLLSIGATLHQQKTQNGLIVQAGNSKLRRIMRVGCQ
ncbi:hypothetical protein [Cellvibrio mixtus]|uniref:hypothetical protein n=1 Tax=Cellvibrio mixtus TaxID=39650 RepID=UPI0005876175|nr:hypothetical protein [Cellvibrio mixtus]